MPEKHVTFCRICESLCGLEVTTENNRVLHVTPDSRHVATRGFACPKGMKQHAMYDSPDRVRYPLRRRPGTDTFERVSWSDAIHDIGERVRKIRGDHGADAIAMYVGTAAGFGVLHPVFAQGFMNGLGSKSMYSSSTQDCANKFAVSREMYGFPFTLPHPDLVETECLIIVGANPVISKWSFLQVPNPTKHLHEIVARGGAVYTIDPRRTETARTAGEHVFIRPDTDVFFFLAFLHELVRQGGVDRARVAKHMVGFDELERLVEPWTPERCAAVTRVDAEVLRTMVSRYRTANGAAIYCSTGVNMGSNGALAFWLAETINAVSGNLDRRGGTLVAKGIIDFAKFGKRTGTLLRTEKSRLGDFTSVNDAFPGGLLADEILTPGPRQVRALFVTGGNPLITMPNAGKLRDAFAELDLLVTLDIYRNETGQLAHYVLPCTSPLERPDLPFVFPLMLGLQVKPYLQATRRVIAPEGEVRDEATIYLDLARACDAPLFGSRVFQRTLEFFRDRHSRQHPGEQPSLPQEGILNAILRLCGQRSFESLLTEPHGVAREAHRDQDFLSKRVITSDRKVHLTTSRLLAQASGLEAHYAAEKKNARRLKLITKRAVTTHNSWTHNHPEFVAGDRNTNYVYMHPDDANAAGLHDDDLADVSTDTATVRVPVRVLADLMPGTVALPHGWGHQHASGLSVASKTRGVNVNLLAADGPQRLEKLSGMAHLTGFVVDVTHAKGPQDPTDWSGIAR